MLESLTIFRPGGLILYQYCSSPSLLQASDPAAHTRTLINALVQTTLSDPSKNSKDYHITEGVTLSWISTPEYYIVAIYPDILFEGPRQYLKLWCRTLLERTGKEYDLYFTNAGPQLLRPDPKPFDKTFKILLNSSKTQKDQQPKLEQESKDKGSGTAPVVEKKKKEGKEKRTWGDAKVTEAAMAELDKSGADGKDSEAGYERALKEAREAYLPTDAEIKEDESEDMELTADETTWTSTVSGLFAQLTGNKVLSAIDLEKPLSQMEDVLKSKNVAATIAVVLCDSVRQQLVGKKLKSMASVQTAVQQALEKTLTGLLVRGSVDLLRNVLRQKSMFTGKRRRPYVLTVMGINGIGKTTTLAKLAYYFKQNGCKPLLVAGDTFRSGAVEQLRVHADCLGVPLFSQGYSKDPALLAQSAIAHASEQGNDVVLIDTAGRMQNNVPLMKALGKLVTLNKPDFCLLACEALVGHDGLSQYKMFQQASRVDGLILTKFDTVDKKMGASLTLTCETGAPIVFLGVGQKYHHLKKLHVSTVVKSLFS